MDRATAARLEKTFAALVRAYTEDTYEPEGALDEYRPAGLMPASLLPKGSQDKDALIAVREHDGANVLIPFARSTAGKFMVDKPLPVTVEWVPVMKPAKAAAANDSTTMKGGAVPEKSEAAKPATDAFRVDLDKFDEQQKAKARAQAAKNRPADLTPDQAREKLRQIGRGTLAVSHSELQHIDRVASRGRKASASAFDLATEDKAGAAKDEKDDQETRSAKHWANRNRRSGDE